MTDKPTPEDEAADQNHPVTDAAIQCLTAGEGTSLIISAEDTDKLLFVITELNDAGHLAIIADELLEVAISLDKRHNSPATADVFAEMARRAADRSLEMRGEITGEMHRIADVGKRYKKFIDDRSSVRDRRDEPLPAGETLSVTALNPKRRV